MMEPTESHEIVEVGRAKIGPVDDVVPVCPSGATTPREPAPAITFLEEAAQPGRDLAGYPPDTNSETAGIVDRRLDSTIAGESKQLISEYPLAGDEGDGAFVPQFGGGHVDHDCRPIMVTFSIERLRGDLDESFPLADLHVAEEAVGGVGRSLGSESKQCCSTSTPSAPCIRPRNLKSSSSHQIRISAAGGGVNGSAGSGSDGAESRTSLIPAASSSWGRCRVSSTSSTSLSGVAKRQRTATSSKETAPAASACRITGRSGSDRPTLIQARAVRGAIPRSNVSHATMSVAEFRTYASSDSNSGTSSSRRTSAPAKSVCRKPLASHRADHPWNSDPLTPYP